MDARLESQVKKIVQHATENGWECLTQPVEVGGVDEAVGIGGVWYALDPETNKRTEYLFTIALGINPRTGRVNTFEQISYGNALFVITIEDGSGRYWHGPASSWRRALADPLAWCGQ